MPNDRTTGFGALPRPVQSITDGRFAASSRERSAFAAFLAKWGALLVLLLFAAAVRLIVLALHAGSPIEMDGTEYVRMAQNLAAGEGLVGVRGFPVVELSPLLPLLIAALTFVVRNAEAAALAIAVLTGVAYVGLLYAVTRTLYGELSARIAASIGAVLPILVQLSTESLSEMPFGAAFLGGLWALLRFVRAHRIADAAFCAAAFGLAYLTRPEGSLLLAWGFAVVTLTALAHARSLRAPAAFAAIGLALVIPYALATVRITGHVALESKTAINFMLGTGMLGGASYLAVADAVEEGGRPVGPEIAPQYYDPRLQAPHIPLGARLGLMARAAVRHVHDLALTFGAREFGFGLLIVFGIVGLTRNSWSRARRRDELILFGFVALIYLALSTVVHFWPRYAVALVPFALIWTGRGVVELHRWSRRSRLLDAGFILLALLLAGSLAVDLAQARPTGAPIEQRAGAWLARHGPPHPRVIEVSDRVAFYGGATWAPFPYAGEGGAVGYLTAVAPDYVVLDSARGSDYPRLAHWFAGAPPARLLRLDYRADDGNGRTVRVYRWLPSPPPGGPSLPPPVSPAS